MRAVLAVVPALALLAGCAELGVVTDGSTIAYGKPNKGRLVDGRKLPDSGAGFVLGDIWKARGNRYGTDELVDLIKGVSKRVKKQTKGPAKNVRLVVADLSGTGGGAAHTFHRSHQNGRDVDLLYFVRDQEGKPIEPEVMRPFDTKLVARDGSGITVDVPRTWQLVKELLTADEAWVQYIFMYRPIAEKLIEHATTSGEPDVIIQRAMKALKQPGDSAPHNDHMHVRIYCPQTDRQFGCVDIGPRELLAEREVEQQRALEAIAMSLPPAGATPTPAGATTVAAVDDDSDDEVAPPQRSAADVWREAAAKRAGQTETPSISVGTMGSTTPTSASSFSTLLRASSHRIDLRNWR